QLAASEVEKIVKKGGLSLETADEIRQKILGITA
ncbi:phage protein Gp27 family protein, partial [Pasteurella multocida]